MRSVLSGERRAQAESCLGEERPSSGPIQAPEGRSGPGQMSTWPEGPSTSLSKVQDNASSLVRSSPFSIPATATAVTNCVAWPWGEERHFLFTVGSRRTPKLPYINAISPPFTGKTGLDIQKHPDHIQRKPSVGELDNAIFHLKKINIHTCQKKRMSDNRKENNVSREVTLSST